MPEMNPVSQVGEDLQPNKAKNNEVIDWNVNVEIKLFKSMVGLKPVGVNRFFMMTAIHQRFSSCMDQDLSSKVIWEHLDSMYDMAALHESEIIPFPNEEEDYELPKDYEDLVMDKYGVSLSDFSTNKIDADTKNSKKSNLLKSKLNTPVSSPKSPFLAPAPPPPVSGKSKSIFIVKTEPKTPTPESSAKNKYETLISSKNNKLVKAGRSEVIVKEEPSDFGNKKSKSEKTSKPESSNVNTSGKKSAKNLDTSDSSLKKNRNEKETLNKKNSKSSTLDTSVSKKNAKKPDLVTPRKTSDTSTKNKNESKSSSKRNDDDSPHPSGSRKSANAKMDDSDKKRKRSKIEDSNKKTTPINKRRRT